MILSYVGQLSLGERGLIPGRTQPTFDQTSSGRGPVTTKLHSQKPRTLRSFFSRRPCSSLASMHRIAPSSIFCASRESSLSSLAQQIPNATPSHQSFFPGAASSWRCEATTPSRRRSRCRWTSRRTETSKKSPLTATTTLISLAPRILQFWFSFENAACRCISHFDLNSCAESVLGFLRMGGIVSIC